MKYKIISSGSEGNCVVINDCIAIDIGVSFKALQSVYKTLKIVLLTHIHGDHFNTTTIKTLSRERPTLRFGCGTWLVKSLIDCGVSRLNIDVYEAGKIYDYTAFRVSPVILYHDVKNYGYRLYKGGERAIYATDTSHLQGITAKNYDLYLIEANYDEEELQERIRLKQGTGEYIYENRVINTHLSKDQADAFLLENMSEDSEYVYLHCHKEKTEQ